MSDTTYRDVIDIDVRSAREKAIDRVVETRSQSALDYLVEGIAPCLTLVFIKDEEHRLRRKVRMAEKGEGWFSYSAEAALARWRLAHAIDKKRKLDQALLTVRLVTTVPLMGASVAMKVAPKEALRDVLIDIIDLIEDAEKEARWAYLDIEGTAPLPGL